MHNGTRIIPLLALMIGLYCGTQPTLMVEAAPVQVRCTAVALGYNICLGVIGGLTPLAAYEKFGAV